MYTQTYKLSWHMIYIYIYLFGIRVWQLLKVGYTAFGSILEPYLHFLNSFDDSLYLCSLFFFLFLFLYVCNLYGRKREECGMVCGLLSVSTRNAEVTVAVIADSVRGFFF